MVYLASFLTLALSDQRHPASRSPSLEPIQRWRSSLRHCAISRTVAGSIPNGVTGNFSLTESFRPHYVPGFDSASNRNEYQEYLLGGKGGRGVGLTLPPSCADCLEIWDHQFPGTLRGCPGL
jgi:hypothetical protein